MYNNKTFCSFGSLMFDTANVNCMKTGYRFPHYYLSLRFQIVKQLCIWLRNGNTSLHLKQCIFVKEQKKKKKIYWFFGYLTNLFQLQKICIIEWDKTNSEYIRIRKDRSGPSRYQYYLGNRRYSNRVHSEWLETATVKPAYSVRRGHAVA
jgi:hypothetical protein